MAFWRTCAADSGPQRSAEDARRKRLVMGLRDACWLRPSRFAEMFRELSINASISACDALALRNDAAPTLRTPHKSSNESAGRRLHCDISEGLRARAAAGRGQGCQTCSARELVGDCGPSPPTWMCGAKHIIIGTRYDGNLQGSGGRQDERWMSVTKSEPVPVRLTWGTGQGDGEGGPIGGATGQAGVLTTHLRHSSELSL